MKLLLILKSTFCFFDDPIIDDISDVMSFCTANVNGKTMYYELCNDECYTEEYIRMYYIYDDTSYLEIVLYLTDRFDIDSEETVEMDI